MKRSRKTAQLTFCLLLAGSLLLIAAMFGGPTPSAAQGTPSATLSLDDRVNAALTEAHTAVEAANSTTANANQSIATVNLMLAFIQVAGLIVGVVVTLSATFAARAGFRTLNEYRAELDAARADLNNLRTELQTDAQTAQQALSQFDIRIEEGLRKVHAQSEHSIRALALLQLGEQQMEARNMKAALDTFLEAYKYDPNNRATNYFIGELYVQRQELEKGIDHLKRTRAERDDYYPPAQAAIGLALRLQGEKETEPNARSQFYAQAEQNLLQALEHDPFVRDINGESVYGTLGGLYRRQGRIPDAIRCYEQAEQVTPQKSYPINNLAVLYLVQGEQDVSARYFDRSIALSSRLMEVNPFDFWPHFNLVTANIVRGNVDEAQRQLDEGLALNPDLTALEGLLDGLLSVKKIPQPPAHVDEMIARVQQAIDKIRLKV